MDCFPNGGFQAERYGKLPSTQLRLLWTQTRSLAAARLNVHLRLMQPPRFSGPRIIWLTSVGGPQAFVHLYGELLFPCHRSPQAILELGTSAPISMLGIPNRATGPFRKKHAMGEYEPEDSRKITQNSSKTPIEPPRTGPAEHATRTKETSDETGEGKSPTPKSNEDARWQIRKVDRAVEKDSAKPRPDA